VIARYADGSTRDVTREASYTSNTPSIAEVTPEGLVTSSRKGEAAVLVRYEGAFVTVNSTILPDKPGFQWVQLPRYNYIDEAIDKKLQKVRIVPSELSSDAEFLRRASLDLIGLTPTPQTVRAFLTEPGPTQVKRQRAMDRSMAPHDLMGHAP